MVSRFRLIVRNSACHKTRSLEAKVCPVESLHVRYTDCSMRDRGVRVLYVFIYLFIYPVFFFFRRSSAWLRRDPLPSVCVRARVREADLTTATADGLIYAAGYSSFARCPSPLGLPSPRRRLSSLSRKAPFCGDPRTAPCDVCWSSGFIPPRLHL